MNHRSVVPLAASLSTSLCLVYLLMRIVALKDLVWPVGDSQPNSGFSVDQIDHVELFVPDRYQAAEWYNLVLGLKIVPEYEHWARDPHGPLMISSDRTPYQPLQFSIES